MERDPLCYRLEGLIQFVVGPLSLLSEVPPNTEWGQLYKFIKYHNTASNMSTGSIYNRVRNPRDENWNDVRIGLVSMIVGALIFVGLGSVVSGSGFEWFVVPISVILGLYVGLFVGAIIDSSR